MKIEQIQDLAIQYATEGLDAENKMIYDAWVISASDHDKHVFSEMVDACSEVSIAGLKSEEIISDRVKTDLLGAITRGEHDHVRSEHGDVKTIRKDDQEWVNLPVKGARLLELSARKKDGFAMSIIEIEPKTEFPEHEHHGVEMAYILEGDLEADGETLYAGDFFRADAGTHHGTHYSPSGCRALIVTANENYRHNTVKVLGGVQKVFSKVKSLIKT